MPSRKPPTEILILDYRNSDILQEAARRLDLATLVLGTRYETIFFREILASTLDFLRRPNRYESISHAYFLRLIQRSGTTEVWASSTFTSVYYALARDLPSVQFKFFQLVIVDDATLKWRHPHLESGSYKNVTIFCHSSKGGLAHLSGLRFRDIKVLGSLRNNFLEENAVNAKEVDGKVITLVSQFRSNYVGRGFRLLEDKSATRMWAETYPKFLAALSRWAKHKGARIQVIPSANNSTLRAELDYYAEHLKCSWIALDNDGRSSYELASLAEHLVSSHSTLAFEMAARGKRVTLCPPARDLKIEGGFWKSVYESDPEGAFIAAGVSELGATLDRTCSAPIGSISSFATHIHQNVIALLTVSETLSIIDSDRKA